MDISSTEIISRDFQKRYSEFFVYYDEKILSLRLKQSIRIYFYTAKKSPRSMRNMHYRICTNVKWIIKLYQIFLRTFRVK